MKKNRNDFPASSTKPKRNTALKFMSSDESMDESDDNVGSLEYAESAESDDANHNIPAAYEKVRDAWRTINPPNKEEKIIGKWYGVIYKATIVNDS